MEDSKKKPSLVEGEIVSVKGLSKEVFEATIVVPDSFQEPEPFQFVGILYGNYQLRRPLSVAGFENGRLRLIFKVKGRMTEELSKAKTGEVLSILGPLGKGFDAGEFKRILAVAGGVGIAPFLYFIQKLKTKKDISLVYGVKTVEDAWFEDVFTDLKGFLLVAEDGTSGYPGYPVDYVVAVSEQFKPDLILCVGPKAMFNSLKTVSQQLGVPAFASLEPFMGCGMGACCSCLVPLSSGGYLKACTEGPVFNLSEVRI